tara:strand:- start:136 stop:516 length:381 start_codon:yes stop_codon:yes gene_type:complete
MLISSEAFVQHYFWKYLDMSINRAEYMFIKESYPVNDHVERMINRFRHIFGTSRDYNNYAFVLSQMRDRLLENFLVFYKTMVHRFVHEKPHDDIRIDPATVEGLDKFVGDDVDLFKMVLISAHYFL